VPYLKNDVLVFKVKSNSETQRRLLAVSNGNERYGRIDTQDNSKERNIQLYDSVPISDLEEIKARQEDIDKAKQDNPR